MKQKSMLPGVLLGLSMAIGTLAPLAALAGLGADARTVSADRDALHGQLQSTSMQQYDVHEITRTDGSLVREYATPQGKIFAVSWKGPLPPNLQQLFGSYFDQYQAAATTSAQTHAGMHRQLAVSQADFVMQSLGRLRAFHGKAYVPSLIPAGVSVADLP